MILALSVALFLLLLIVGKSRGFKTFISFYLSFAIIGMFIIFMSIGINAIILSLITCILASAFILFFLNGNNIKTKASFISVVIVFLIMFLVTLVIVKNANIQGFSQDSIESIGGFSFELNYSMANVLIGMLLVGLIGTIIDTSMSVSSALYEVYENNPHLGVKVLFKSGMNIGKDILSTTINTLYFALIINFIGFFLWHRNTSLAVIINYKVFCEYVINLLLCFIASILIIPITALISANLYVNHIDMYE